MRNCREYTEEFKNKVLDESRFMSTIEAARQFNIPESTIKGWRDKRFGSSSKQTIVSKAIEMVIPEKKTGCRAYSEEFKTMVLNATKEKTVAEVAHMYNVHEQTIYRWKAKIKKYQSKKREQQVDSVHLLNLEKKIEALQEQNDKLYDLVLTIAKFAEKAPQEYNNNVKRSHVACRKSNRKGSVIREFQRA